jgi:hypothetical protein
MRPATHLAARIAGRQAFHIEFAPERVDQLRAVAVVEPGILLTGIEPERSGAEQRPSRILADIVIIGRVPHLDGSVLYGVEHLQGGHDLAGGEALDLELAVGRLGHIFGDRFTTPVEGVQRFRPACRQPPSDGWRRLGDCGLGDGSCGRAGSRGDQELTAFHVSPLLWIV